MTSAKCIRSRASVVALYGVATLTGIVGVVSYPLAWILCGRQPLFKTATRVGTYADSVWGDYNKRVQAQVVDA